MRPDATTEFSHRVGLVQGRLAAIDTLLAVDDWKADIYEQLNEATNQ